MIKSITLSDWLKKAVVMVFCFAAAHAQTRVEKKGQEIGASLMDAALWSGELAALEERYRVKPTEQQERMAEMKKKMIESKGGKMGDANFGGFAWLSSNKDGLRAAKGEFEIFAKKVGEITVKSNSGKVGMISVSLYNRGDDGDLSLSSLQRLYQEWETLISEKTGQRGEIRKATSAVKIEGHMWRKGDTAWLLEKSLSKDGGVERAEFLRLRLASISAVSNAKSMAGRSNLPANVKRKENGDVAIEGIPMVDQGEKGYCAVASVARIAGYYGLDVDQHEIAQVADTSAFGTSPDKLEEAFKKITGKLHIRTTQKFELKERQFQADIRAYNQIAKKEGEELLELEDNEYFIAEGVWRMMKSDIFRRVKAGQSGCKRYAGIVHDSIDEGVPVAWCLRLGMFKEEGIPQTSGGHMRLIIGYNEAADEVIYTDSWGKGHEYKRMPVSEAYAMSYSLYIMAPTR